eukprot:jgi/Galph1/2378/GphlegSOOS_G1072.1
MIFCRDDCVSCLFLKQHFVCWGLKTIQTVHKSNFRNLLWEELLRVATKTTCGNPKKFLIHLAEVYHHYLLFLEEILFKYGNHLADNVEQHFIKEELTDSLKDAGFCGDVSCPLLSLSFEEMVPLTVQLLAELHICLIENGFLLRWMIEFYRLVRLFKTVDSQLPKERKETSISSVSYDGHYNIWQFMLLDFPMNIYRYAVYMLNNFSNLILYGLDEQVTNSLFCYLKMDEEHFIAQKAFHWTEKDVVLPTHRTDKDSSHSLLSMFIFEDSPTPFTMSHSSNQFAHRSEFINLEQNWDRVVYCFRKWNGDVLDGTVGMTDGVAIRQIFEELVPINVDTFSRRWLYLLFQECVHGEEQTLANIQKLGVTTSLEKVHHLQSRMHPKKQKPKQEPLNSAVYFNGVERFFMEMIQVADSCQWNCCLLLLLHQMMEKISSHIEDLTMMTNKEEEMETYREECIVDCILYGRLATKFLGFLLMLTGPHHVDHKVGIVKDKNVSSKKEHVNERKKGVQSNDPLKRRMEKCLMDSVSFTDALANLQFDKTNTETAQSHVWICMASNYWKLYINAYSNLQKAMSTATECLGYSLACWLMWTPYLAIAASDMIVSHTKWFQKCLEWIKQIRTSIYSMVFTDNFVTHLKIPSKEHDNCLRGWILCLSIIEEQIPLHNLDCWWNMEKQFHMNKEILNLFQNCQLNNGHHDDRRWIRNKRLLWHCLPQMKEFHRQFQDLERALDAIHLSQQTKVDTMRWKTSRKIQPFDASLYRQGVENSEYKFSLVPNRYVEQLNPIQQLVQRVMEKKLQVLFEPLECSNYQNIEEWWEMTGLYWHRAYDLCWSLFNGTVENVLQQLDVPRDAFRYAIEQTFDKTVQRLLWRSNQNQSEKLEMICKRISRSCTRCVSTEKKVRDDASRMSIQEIQLERNVPIACSTAYQKVCWQLVTEHPISMSIEQFLIQNLELLRWIDEETYQNFGVYGLEQRWLKCSTMLVDMCRKLEGNQVKLSQLSRWLWERISKDKTHPLIQQCLSEAIYKIEIKVPEDEQHQQ